MRAIKVAANFKAAARGATLCTALLTLAACQSSNDAERAAKIEATPPQGPAMVAAADPRAVQAGLEVIRDGGSAVDAAIAVQSMIGLVEPQSSGIAGGAFMIFYNAKDGSVTMYDGRETAPAAAGPDLFTDANGKRLPYIQGIASGKSTGVPGVVAMLHLAHSEHGTLPWARGFERAISLADEGFEISPRLAESLAYSAKFELLNQQKAAREYFFLEDGVTPLPAGYTRNNPAYAQSLRAIAADYKAMYEGAIVDEILEAVGEEPRPGLLTAQDFAAYKPRKRGALCSSYKVYKICGAQPPSSGGVATQAIMRILENTDIGAQGATSAHDWHLFIEASRLAYADRDQLVADDSFIDVPIGPMLDANYLKSRSALISPEATILKIKAGDPAGFSRGKDATPDSPGTSHFSIVDRAGNVVSMTTTVEAGFGSQRMAAGMVLNNQLTDFSFVAIDDEGKPVANAVAGGKRPRSSMSPTIVFDEKGEFLIATGSPGGNSIIAYVAKTLVGMLEWGLTPSEAAALPNVIARGDRTVIEEPLMSPDLIAQLRALGHDLSLSDEEMSGIHIIRRMPDGSLLGGADPRREGVAWSLDDIK